MFRTGNAVACVLQLCLNSRVGLNTNAQRLERAAASTSTPYSARGKRRMTPTAVSAQPAEKAVDADKGNADPLLLRAARGEVSVNFACCDEPQCCAVTKMGQHVPDQAWVDSCTQER